MPIYDSSRQFDFLRQNLSLYAKSLTALAERLRRASSAIALDAPLLDSIVADIAAATTALETLAGTRVGLSTGAPACVADHALIHLHVNFCPVHCLFETYCDLGLVIYALCVVSGHPFLTLLLFEVKEFIKVIKDLLPEILFVLLALGVSS